MLRKINVAASWQYARQQFAALTAERDALRRELFEIRAERNELRARLIELLDAIRARQAAEDECRALYREHDELQRVERAQRDPERPLH